MSRVEKLISNVKIKKKKIDNKFNEKSFKFCYSRKKKINYFSSLHRADTRIERKAYAIELKIENAKKYKN